MENGIQHVLLKARSLALAGLIATPMALAQETEPSAAHRIDSEVFDLGVTAGVVNIADFNGEWALGVSATFQASENFFLQYNFLQADSSPSAYENSQGLLFDGGDRTFRHYDLLVGYKLFQSEFFADEGRARLSSLYLVGGAGETRFGGEENFTTTLGVGYEVALTRDVLVRLDYRAYLYDSSLVADEEQSVTSNQLSAGVSYLF
ncbi:outer membrane beta-barrel domain-containing protein [Marinimicrobium agarilyticum]|uniref:outer membrane beta-barrel domain-containing protein n=1 Tax=Marinimicrobium agarilyticum TaxID=306546 RepID=UPI00040FCB45|nr:outer membrane beta-barrel domain-containing protein [Marinimicrobium agarilyticum]